LQYKTQKRAAACNKRSSKVTLQGRSFLAAERGQKTDGEFRGLNPATGEELEPSYSPVTEAEAEVAVQQASAAARVFAATSSAKRAELLRAMAARIDARAQLIAERAHLETALPMPRLTGEVARTTGQLRLFASMIEEGSWVDARIDSALPDRKPMARPDLRSMLRPIGPVVVFGASNFPVAFSAAGGDTAAAIAAGCPVIVKAHSAHPGTSELVAEAIHEALAECALPHGIYSLIYGSGSKTGALLVKHPLVKAVTFTGSLRAGRIIMDMAAARPEPIPCFMEMSCSNPFFVLPSAIAENPEALAQSLFASFTLGAGQFCTKPGIVFVESSATGKRFVDAICEHVKAAQPFTLLTKGISRDYDKLSAERSSAANKLAEAALPEAHPAAPAQARLFQLSLNEFLKNPAAGDEIFGPNTLIVTCPSAADFVKAAEAVGGQLTATVWGKEEEICAYRELLIVLHEKAGRVMLNNFPTGVEVVPSMVHGGPYPATSDVRFTSVGTQAIYRFVRPACWQNFPQQLLPAELLDANPLGIERLVDGILSRRPIQ